jgi:hypothetical protein
MPHLLCLFLCFLPGLSVRTDTPPTVADVVAKVRQATGYDKFKTLTRGLRQQGTVKYLGVEGEFEQLGNAEGHFVRTIKHRLGEIQGFDGKDCWIVEQGQISRTLDLEERESTLAVFWVLQGHWLSETSPFDITVAAEGTNDKMVSLQLHLKKGLWKATLSIDRATWLPTAMERNIAGSKMTWSFEDYREVLGVKLPFKVTSTRAGLASTTTVQQVTEAPTFVRNPYALVPVQPQDVVFDPAVPAEVKVERFRSGHFLVQPKVNGEDVGWFIFDSGAGGMVIDKQVADKLGMETFGEVPVVGVGGVLPGRFRQAKNFQLGPVTLKDAVFVEIDLRTISMAMGRKVAGICGAPLLKRTVVELESTPPRLALHDPAKYKLEGGTWQDLLLKNSLPCTKAKFEGDREALFRLDTGAHGTVTFHAPAVQNLKLLEGRQTRASFSGGVGGMAPERVGELEWFELGGHRFQKPRVAFSQAKTGAFADEYAAGNIGTGFLEPFRIVFNYPQKKIALVKRAGKEQGQ